MKLRPYVLVVPAALFFMIVIGAKEAKPSVGITPGDYAPGIESLESELKNVDFQNHSGRYTLLNFWAAYDAESRARNVQLANEVSKLGSERIAMFSFSLDEKESVFSETVKADKLDSAMQFHEELGKESVLYKTYHRRGGFKNFLINGEGLIVATDVTSEKLADFF